MLKINDGQTGKNVISHLHKIIINYIGDYSLNRFEAQDRYERAIKLSVKRMRPKRNDEIVCSALFCMLHYIFNLTTIKGT